ncbi:MAG TPA: transcription antitermination factor NusB [Gaiellales bacterium]|nr:transcription antitermination factor NusB [Gaiellales bacterium]
MSARGVACEVVRRTFEEDAYTNRAFRAEAERAELDDRERRQAMRLAFGTVQRVRTLDHALESLAGRPAGELQPTLRAALRIGAYQLLFSEGVPAHAAVNETVELCKRVAGLHTAGLANAVLRRISAAGPEWVAGLPVALRHSYPDWVAREWEEMLGAEDAEAVMAAQNEPPELSVRMNSLRARDVDLGVPAHRDPDLPEALVIDAPFDVAGSEELAAGLIWPQSRAAMLPARLLAPEPGMRVLDLCAAPGGKAGQLAALMENRGELVCVERHAGRAGALHATLDRFGASCARVVEVDALEFSEAGFDRILLDPPCSGLGVLAGRPDARWRGSEAAADRMAETQRRMLEHARTLLAPGGRLVYSVCTIRRAEGEEVLAGGRQTLPHRDGTDGFYMAAIDA